MLARLDALVEQMDRRLDGWHLGDAAESLRGAFWGEFCDTYLEAAKVPELADLPETKQVLHHALRTYLALFHPFMPFVTEHLWQEIGGGGLLIRAAWPVSGGRDAAAPEVAGTDALVRLVSAVMRVRAEQEIDPFSRVGVTIRPRAHEGVLRSGTSVIERLARTESIAFVAPDADLPRGAAAAVDADFDVAVALSAADREAMRARLEKQLEKARGQLASVEKRLENESFVTRAAPEAVERARADAEQHRTTVAALEERLAAL